MNIIQITPYYPPHLGGMEQRVKDLSEKLSKKRHNVKVFTSNIGTKEKRISVNRNLEVSYLKAKEFAQTPIIFNLFKKLLKLKNVDIFHIHIAQPLTPEIAYLLAKLRKTPYIAHVRIDLEPSGTFGFLVKPYKKIFLSKVLKNANRVIVLTEDYKKIIIEKYRISENRIKIIPNATNFKIKNKKHIEKEDITLLFVGRISKQKDIPLLLNSLYEAIKKNKIKKIKLKIVGDGEERNSLEKLVNKLKLENNVIFLGRKEEKELEKEYEKSDIFIMTSKQESFGTTLIEAMSKGLPIITTDILAVRNIVKNNYNGILVKPELKEIAKKINLLANDRELRQKFSENGLKEVKKYSWDKIIEQTEEVYKEVLNENKQN